MIEQVIKENTETMRELIAALRGMSAPQVHKAEAPKVEAPKVEAPKVEAPKVEAPKVESAEWTRDNATPAFLQVCKSEEGKKRARDSLAKFGKSRLSELPDDMLPAFMASLGL